MTVAAIVLAGGGARGAYEAGVLRYLRDEVPGGATFAPRILCGTSVGAIHASFLAATADRPAEQGRALAAIWEDLELGDVFRLGLADLVQAWRRMGGGEAAPGGLVDAAPLEELVRNRIPWERLRANIDGGVVGALSVSATEVSTGKTVVFVDRTGGGVPPWSRDAHVVARARAIGPLHTLASAAIPFVFPAVRVDGEFFCDGGLRQNTPLSPALRLGAERVLVVGARHAPRIATDAAQERAREADFPTPLFLAGKVLNALLLDRIDYDLARLEGFNTMLDGLEKAFGPDAIARLAETMQGSRGQAYRRVRAVYVRPSKDIGRMAGEYASSDEFRSRTKGLTGRLARRLANREASREADFLSYFLFDGGFARQLMALGFEDARARHADLAGLVAG